MSGIPEHKFKQDISFKMKLKSTKTQSQKRNGPKTDPKDANTIVLKTCLYNLEKVKNSAQEPSGPSKHTHLLSREYPRGREPHKSFVESLDKLEY